MSPTNVCATQHDNTTPTTTTTHGTVISAGEQLVVVERRELEVSEAASVRSQVRGTPFSAAVSGVED